MLQILEYYGKFQGLRGNVTGLPAWARFILVASQRPAARMWGSNFSSRQRSWQPTQLKAA